MIIETSCIKAQAPTYLTMIYLGYLAIALFYKYSKKIEKLRQELETERSKKEVKQNE